MGTSMIKEWSKILGLCALIVITLGVSISARHIDGHNILKRGAYEAPASAPKEAAAAPPAEAPKETPSEAPKDAMPAGALPHPVVQSPEHVNEPKVAAGEQHASGKKSENITNSSHLYLLYHSIAI